MRLSVGIALAVAAVASLGGSVNTESRIEVSNLEELLRLELTDVSCESRKGTCAIACTLTNLSDQAIQISKIAFDGALELRLWRVNTTDVFVPNGDYPPPSLPHPLPMISIGAKDRVQVQVIIPLARDHFVKRSPEGRPSVVARLPAGQYAIDATPRLQVTFSNGAIVAGLVPTWNKFWLKN